MKYSLLAAALVTLIFTGCDQLRQKEPGEGKPGQYPPSLWEKREGQVSDAEIEAAQKADAEAAAKKSGDASAYTPPKPEYDASGKKAD
ncbi:MAG: hypothetical protein ABIN99_03585 [Nitrosospira sp.]|jgi:hypothetical protein